MSLCYLPIIPLMSPQCLDVYTAYYGSRYRHEEPLHVLVYYILGALSDRVHNYDSNTTSACEAKMEPVKNLQNYCHTIYMVSSAVKIISHDL